MKGCLSAKTDVDIWRLAGGKLPVTSQLVTNSQEENLSS